MPDMTVLNKYKQTRLELTEADHRVLALLHGFVPDNVFDAHAHINPAGGLSNENESYAGYCQWMGPLLGNPSNIRLNMLAEVLGDELCTREGRRAVNDYLSEQLAKAPNCVGSPLIGPDDTPEQIAERLSRPQIGGIKCYATTAPAEKAANLVTQDFLSEAAWEAANERKLPICLHLIRYNGLADADNVEYIKTMTARYPDAKLVLAHAARGFASWTTVENIDQIAHIDNVWFDISCVCEVGPIAAVIMRTAGKKVMWGSDYPVCKYRGRAISLADNHIGLTGPVYGALEPLLQERDVHACLYALENLLAFKQTATLLNLDQTQIEDIFYNNAMNLYGLKA